MAQNSGDSLQRGFIPRNLRPGVGEASCISVARALAQRRPALPGGAGEASQGICLFPPQLSPAPLADLLQ